MLLQKGIDISRTMDNVLRKAHLITSRNGASTLLKKVCDRCRNRKATGILGTFASVLTLASIKAGAMRAMLALALRSYTSLTVDAGANTSTSTMVAVGSG